MTKRQNSRKITAALTACLMAASLVGNMPCADTIIHAAQTQWKFDFGANGAAGGYTQVTASTGYSSSQGYGFSNTSQVKDVNAAGSGELSDAVQFTSTSTNNTFNVDLPNGLYEMTVKLGNTTRASVWAEDVLQIINMTGNNAADTIQIPVTDGQLNLMVTEGKANTAFTLSALELTKLSDDPTMEQTIWVCGDSTVCNYYPLSSSIQAGWAQMLGDYVDTEKFQIRNMAASGQYAKGFVDAGQFAPIEKYGKAGDYYFISIGINDTNYSNGTEYYNTVTDMVKRAHAKGMEVILVKQQGRNGDAQRNLSSRWFAGELDQIGQEQNCQVVDLFNLYQDYCRSIGTEATTALYMGGDTLHPNRAGASKLAELVANEVEFEVLAYEAVLQPNVSGSVITGDVNHDGVIDAFDLCQMKRKFAENSVNAASNPEYDVTGDSAFSDSDLRTMQDYLLGRINKFAENPNRYLAVNAAVNSGVSETTNAGSSTGTYINLDNQIGSSISWNVNVAEDGNYRLTFHNANGGTADRPMRLSLSGSDDTWRVSFPMTGSWTTWSDSTIVVPLIKGTQTVTLTSITADGGPNFDYLYLEKVNDEAAAPESNPAENAPEGARQVEALDRGMIAMKSGNGMFVSWRYLGTDNDTTSFKLYRDGNLVYTSNQDDPTCYQDNGGSTSSVYTLETIDNGTVTETSGVTAVTGNNYLDVPLNPPTDLTMPDGSTCSYHANDCSPADLDGDGEYELVIKWEPSNAKDNSQDGYTGNVYLEGAKLDGTSLWKIDLGVNIRAGAHYTQFMVYDFDGDGSAEIVCKTGDGTKDAKGNVVGNAGADHRTSAGRILSGPEYLTLFDGRNGTILDTVDYEPGRGDNSTWQSVWGDGYGNRMDRFLAAVAYLDGTTPSVVMCRGYYTRAVLVAYDVVDKQLVKRWTFDSNDGGTDKNGKPNSDYRGQGTHSLAVADVDQDGFDEIVYGAACIDHDGKGLYSTKLGHGDALHVGDFLPNRAGLEVFMPHEETFGSSLRDAATGEIILRVNGTGDTGRGIAGNFIGNPNGAVFVCSADAVLYDGNGNNVGSWSDITKWGMNSALWFSGTLERAVMDRNCIDQYGIGRVLTGADIATNNGTKNNACLTADIIGDWREEVIWRAGDSSYLRIYSTTNSTDYRIFTLMHDVQYREQVATQNVSYNQPPNPSFYLGTGFALPELPNVYEAAAQ